MNTHELYNILHGRCDTFLGVFPSDKIPKRKGWCIINLDDSSKKGSHWTVLRGCEFFDPYGVFPLSHNILKHLKKTCGKKGIWYNRVRLQDYDTTTCGHFCVFYLLKRCQGHSPQSIIKFLKAKRNADLFVFNYVKKLSVK